MNSEIETTNLNIAEEKENFKWILGNLFFTSVLVLISLFQLYVYYHNGKEAKYICFGSFFIIFVGLFIVSKNIPLSLLTAMLAANLLFKCGNVQILNNEEKQDDTKHEEHEDEEHDDEEHDDEDEVEHKEEEKKEVKEHETKNNKLDKPNHKKENTEEPVPDLESKKIKDKYVTGSNFEPYLTGDKNNFAYPAAPDILKFQS